MIDRIRDRTWSENRRRPDPEQSIGRVASRVCALGMETCALCCLVQRRILESPVVDEDEQEPSLRKAEIVVKRSQGCDRIFRLLASLVRSDHTGEELDS